MVDNLAQERVVAVALLLEISPLRDIFDGRHPSALHQRLVNDLKRAPVGAFHNGTAHFAGRDILQDLGAKFIGVAVKGSSFLAMPDKVQEVGARPHDLCRQTVHVDVAPVTGNDTRRSIIQHQPLRHVVKGGVEPMPLGFQPLLRFLILSVHLADDQVQNERDNKCGQHRSSDHEPGLLAPIGEHGRNTRGGSDDQREVAQASRRSEPILQIDCTFETHGLYAAVVANFL